jgi:hypothetical protein
LESVHIQNEEVHSGLFGETARAVWGMDEMKRAQKDLIRWRKIVKGRLEAEAIRAANEMMGREGLMLEKAE